MIPKSGNRADQAVLRNKGRDLLIASGAAADASRRRRLPRRLFRGIVHALSHRFILRRRTTTQSHAAGFRLLVPPTVFPPRIF